MNDYKRLPPFKWFCLTNFPFIEADFDALTNYELLCKIVQYLNENIVKTNELGEQVEILTNWFNNLDVQEEINNKLDDMVEKGELQEIIADYLNSQAVFGYDNIESMQSATNLLNGSYARTYGYYSKNDGGGAFYKIRTITNDDVVDNATIIPMDDDSLIAELIIENSIVNVKTFGCKGDNETDDTENLQKALTYAKNNNYETFIPTGKYITSDTLEIQAQIIRGEGEYNTIIKPSGCDGILIKYDDIGINKGISDLSLYPATAQIEYAGIIFEQRTNNTRNHNVFLQNLGLQNWGCAIYMQDCHRCTVQNIGIWNCFIGLNIQRKTVQCSFINVCDNYNLAEDLTSVRFGSDNTGALIGDHTQVTQKPEGIKFTQCCFTNHNIGLNLDFCLYFNAYQCEFDICRKKCIYFRNVDGGCVINGCWLNIRGTNATNSIEILTVQTTDESTIEILNNIFTATDIGEENTCSAIKNTSN